MVFAVLIGWIVLCSACSGSRPATLPPVDGGQPVRYVALGASDSVGVGTQRPLAQGWPQLLLRTALPPAAELLNVASDGATVADGLARQVPLALSVQPDLTTVAFGVNDLRAGVAPADFEQQLADLVHALRRDGATRVLVANVPPLDRLPAFLAEAGRTLPTVEEVDALVDDYDAAVARVAQREGAELVDLHATGLAARAEGVEASLVADDGFHPSAAGHQRIADAFRAVLG